MSRIMIKILIISKSNLVFFVYHAEDPLPLQLANLEIDINALQLGKSTPGLRPLFIFNLTISSGRELGEGTLGNVYCGLLYEVPIAVRVLHGSPSGDFFDMKELLMEELVRLAYVVPLLIPLSKALFGIDLITLFLYSKCAQASKHHICK